MKRLSDVNRQNKEFFSIDSNRGVWAQLKHQLFYYVIEGHRDVLGMFAIQLMYSGNFGSFCSKESIE